MESFPWKSFSDAKNLPTKASLFIYKGHTMDFFQPLFLFQVCTKWQFYSLHVFGSYVSWIIKYCIFFIKFL